VRTIVRDKEIVLGKQTLAIQTTKKRGCYLEILEALKSQMDAFLSHHARMLFVRVDLHQYEYSDDNKPMSDFMRKFIKRLKRDYKMTRVGYLWVREMEKAKRQHYHLVVMLDGRAVRYPKKVIEVAESIADGWGWPKPFTPKKCYYTVHRSDFDSFAQAFRRGSYLAKERGKGYKGITANNYGRSVIRQLKNS
jgi:Inovirus Gp2